MDDQGEREERECGEEGVNSVERGAASVEREEAGRNPGLFAFKRQLNRSIGSIGAFRRATPTEMAGNITGCRYEKANTAAP